MTKRYDVIYGEEPRRQVVTNNGIPCTARTCVTRLNRLTEENEQLKLGIVRLKSHVLRTMPNYTGDFIEEIINGEYKMTKKTEDIEVCAEISTKRMFLLLMKAQEMILENNPQYKKREILTLLSSVTHDVRMLDDENNRIDRDLYD